MTAPDLALVATDAPEPHIPYRMFVASTITGEIVTDMPFVGTPRWSYSINQSGGLTPSVPLGVLSRKDLDDLTEPWRWSWGLAWGGHILQAGPVVTDRYNDQVGPPTADVGCTGLWGIFSKRILINPWWSKGKNVADPLADITYTNLTLRTIARRMIQGDLGRAGHTLPIVLPAADPAGTHERTYPGYDLATVGERLQQLTQVIDGPEIEFRPEFTDQRQRAIRWVMRVGNPRLGQLGYPHAWDYGQALSHVDYDRDGSQMSLGHFERGNGMERALLSAYQDDKTLTGIASYPYPDLETVGNTSSSVTEQATLQAKADGYVATYARPIINWQATIRMDGANAQGRQTRSPSLDEMDVGDNAAFQLNGHRRITDGTYQRRILGVSNGPNLHSAQLTLQPTS